MPAARKSILITGCSSGIGWYLAEVFNEHGLRVMATARKRESLAELAAKGVETLSLTVDDPASVRACYREVEGLLEGKGLDYIYHNAGKNYTVPATDIVVSEARDMFNTNLFSIMDMNEVFLPLLLKARGTIVATGSVAGIMPYFFGAAYNASKAALKSYLDTLRIELAPFGVHVVNVITAGVKSNIARTDRALAPDSIFRPWAADIYRRRLVQSQTRGQDTRPYADDVVPRVLNARGRFWNTNDVWAGAPWRAIYIMDTIDRYFPGGIWTHYVGRIEGLRR